MQSWQKHLNRIVGNMGDIHISLGALRHKYVMGNDPLFNGLESIEAALFALVTDLEGIRDGSVTPVVRERSNETMQKMRQAVKSAEAAVKATSESRVYGNGWEKRRDPTTGKWRTECAASYCLRCKGQCVYVSDWRSTPLGCDACEHGCARARKFESGK